MRKITRLTLEDRKEIERLLKEGKNGTQISLILNKVKATIYHEIQRNGGALNYCADQAEQMTSERLKKRNENNAIIGKSNIGRSNTVRIEDLEMQMEIISDTLKELRNGNKN